MKEWWLGNWRTLVPTFGPIITALIAIFGIWLKHKLDHKTASMSPALPSNAPIIEHDLIRPKRPRHEYNMGMIKYEREEYFEAIQHLDNAIKEYEIMDKQEYRENEYDHAATLLALGVVYDYLTDSDKACELYDQARAIWESERKENQRELFYVLNNMATSYCSQEKYDDAIGLLKKALEAIEPAEGGEIDVDMILYCCCGLMGAFLKKGDLSNAEEYVNKALAMINGVSFITAVEGMPHQMDARVCAQIYSNAGVLMRRKHENEQAMEYLHKALQIKISVFGEVHSCTAETYVNMGNVYLDQKRYAEAMHCYEKARRGFEDAFPFGHLETAKLFSMMGVASNELNEHANALQYQLMAYKIGLLLYGPKNSITELFYHQLEVTYKACYKGSFTKWLAKDLKIMAKAIEQKGKSKERARPC